VPRSETAQTIAGWIPQGGTMDFALTEEHQMVRKMVRDFAELLRVRTNFVSDIIRDQRGTTQDGRKIYTFT
jgi:hypothetical protein